MTRGGMENGSAKGQKAPPNAAAFGRWSQAHINAERERKESMVIKKIAKSGSLTLPRQIRQETGLLPGVPVDIVADKGGVYIAKHVPACMFCGSVEGVNEVLEIEICQDCAGKIMEVCGCRK